MEFPSIPGGSVAPIAVRSSSRAASASSCLSRDRVSSVALSQGAELTFDAGSTMREGRMVMARVIRLSRVPQKA